MDRQEAMPVGIVLERRRLDHPWKDHDWRPVAVIPGAAPLEPRGAWRQLQEGDGWSRWHAGTLTLRLFRKETEGYRVNLSQTPPRVFVVLRSGVHADCAHEVVPFLATACPYEAQDYLDSGDDQVEPVAMPVPVIAFVQAFVDQHHVDEPFHKRKRKKHDTGEAGFARRAPASRPRRVN